MERKVLAALEGKELDLIRGLHNDFEDARKRYDTTLGFLAARDGCKDPDTRFNPATGEFYLDVEPENKPEVVGDEVDDKR